MKVVLDTWARLTIAQILDGVTSKEGLSTWNKAAKLLDAVELSAEEKEAVGLQLVPSADGRMAYTWNPGSDEKEIELSASLHAFLADRVKAWPEFRPADRAEVRKLFDALSITCDADE